MPVRIWVMYGVSDFGYRTSEKRFQTENSPEIDDPHVNPLYATRELDVEVRVVSRLSHVLITAERDVALYLRTVKSAA